MTPRRARIAALGVLTVVLAVTAGVRLARRRPPRAIELTSATITRLDAASRTGEVEFIHPRSGQVMRLSAQVPPECAVTIDGQAAALGDVRVGDHLSARAYVSGRSIRPEWIRITRAAAPASAPSAAGDAGS